MTSRRAIVKQIVGIAVAVALTAGVVAGVALQLQQGFQPVYAAQRESVLRQQHQAAVQREQAEQQLAAARARGLAAPVQSERRELLAPSR